MPLFESVGEKFKTDEPALRQADVARMLGCSTRYLRKLMDSGALPFERLPGSRERRIPAHEAERLRGRRLAGRD